MLRSVVLCFTLLFPIHSLWQGREAHWPDLYCSVNLLIRWFRLHPFAPKSLPRSPGTRGIFYCAENACTPCRQYMKARPRHGGLTDARFSQLSSVIGHVGCVTCEHHPE